MSRFTLGIVGIRPVVLSALTELLAESRPGALRVPWILPHTEAAFLDDVTRRQLSQFGQLDSRILPVSAVKTLGANSGVDGVLMCGMLNKKLALSLLASGVSVFCETPPSIQTAELLELHDAASSGDAKLVPCLLRRFDAGFQRLQSEYTNHSQTLGRIRNIRVSATSMEPDSSLRSHGFFHRYMLPDMELVRWLSGHVTPASINALACPAQAPAPSLHSPYLDMAVASLDFEDGLRGSVAVSLNTLGCDHRVEVLCDSGSLILEHHPSDGATLLLTAEGDTRVQCRVPVTWKQRKIDSLKSAFIHFLATLQGTEDTPYTLDDVISAIKVTEACSESYSRDTEISMTSQQNTADEDLLSRKVNL